MLFYYVSIDPMWNVNLDPNTQDYINWCVSIDPMWNVNPFRAFQVPEYWFVQ